MSEYFQCFFPDLSYAFTSQVQLSSNFNQRHRWLSIETEGKANNLSIPPAQAFQQPVDILSQRFSHQTM